MIPKTLEELEMTDFETGKKIDGNHYMIIQDPEKEELFTRVNTKTYTREVREVLMERSSSGLGDLERAGENKRYLLCVANKNGRSPMGTISKDMLEKGFPETFKYFNGINLPS